MVRKLKEKKNTEKDKIGLNFFFKNIDGLILPNSDMDTKIYTYQH